MVGDVYEVRIFASGTKSWFKNGVHHREDGPAIEWDDGTLEWHLNGVRHRVNGPAVEWESGHKSWYLNGIWFSDEKDYWKKLKSLGEPKEPEEPEEPKGPKELTVAEVEKLLGYPVKIVKD